MLGKNKGNGEDLLVDSLLTTCLNVYKNPKFSHFLHPPHNKFNGSINEFGSFNFR